MFFKKNTPWSNVFITGTAVLILSWGLSACKFGNKEEIKDRVLYNCQQGWTGFYESNPQSAVACADDDESIGCGPAALEDIPNTLLLETLTNPVGVQVADDPVQKSFFISKDDLTHGYATYFDPITGENQQFILASEPTLLLDSDPNCTVRDYDQHMTVLSRDAGRPVNNVLTCGSLNGSVRQGMIFDQCENAFTRLAECYADEASCGGIPYQDARAFLGLYVESGAVTLEALPQVKRLFYEVTYSP